jgi:predicted metal-binding protein
MKALFNGTCEKCDQFKPRCARVHIRRPGKATQYCPETIVVCEDCRRLINGQYRLAEQHR